MRWIKEFSVAIRGYFKAIDLINEKRYWKYLLLPGLLNLLIFIGIGILAFYYSGELVAYFSALLETTPDSTLGTIFHFLLALVIRLIIFLIYLKMYRYTVLILLAPVLAFMAEKLYYAQHSEKPSFSLVQFVKNSSRGVVLAVNNLMRELIITGTLLLLAVILPVTAFLVPPLIFTVESYYYGFSMFDYFFELQNRSARSSRNMVWTHGSMAMGNGMMFNLLLILPILGVMIAPVLALTAAHVTMQQLTKQGMMETDPD